MPVGVVEGKPASAKVTLPRDLSVPARPTRNRPRGFVARWIQRPEWPLTLLFAWYPLWWLLGITQVAMIVSCVVMAMRLLHLRRLVAPRGFRLWLIFLVWMAFGVLTVHVNAPGAVVGGGSTRYLTWALRLVWYLEATVVLLYVANVRKTVGTARIARILAIMFLTITAGGLIGSLAPMTSFRSLVELVLPSGLSNNAFVSSMIHPVFAQRMSYLGEVQYRPSAPFPYANRWGLNYACFLPIFIYAWCRRSAGWRRVAAPVVLLVSIVPVIYSMNRGLWAVLIVMLVIVILKQARAGHLRPMIMLTVAAVVVAAAIAVSPLGTALTGRFSGHNSNEGRANLSLRSVASVAEGSPVIGFGTTRNVQGSFYSIAGGSTPGCHSCSPPSLGTQGSLWSLMFNQGLVGGSIGLAFFLLAAWRHRRRREPAGVAYLCTLLAFLLTTAIYDWSETASFAVMVAIASLASTATESDRGQTSRSTVESLRPLRRLTQPRILVACCIIGAIAGAGLQVLQGPTYLATTALYLPAMPDNSGVETGDESTLDTQARIIAALDPARGRTERDKAADWSGDTLSVSAEPNTRILEISYRSTNRQRALAGADDVTQTTIQLRALRLKDERTSLLDQADQKISGISSAIASLDAASRAIYGSRSTAGSAAALSELAANRVSLERQQTQLRRWASTLSELSTIGGEVVQPASVRVEPERWNVAIGSGVAVGFLASVLISEYRRRRGVRIGSLSDAELCGLLTCKAVYRVHCNTELAEVGRYVVARHGAEALHIGPAGDRAHAITENLNGIGEGTDRHVGDTPAVGVADVSRPQVFAVAWSRARTSQLRYDLTWLRESGIHIAGVVIAD